MYLTNKHSKLDFSCCLRELVGSANSSGATYFESLHITSKIYLTRKYISVGSRVDIVGRKDTLQTSCFVKKYKPFQ